MHTLTGKTLVITGASRGIGKAIALRAAADGANIAIFAKTETPHPKLPGTIYSAAKEIEEAGGHALPLSVDIREETQVMEAIKKTAEQFGGIDILVNNASAIYLEGTEKTPMKRYDLMQDVNTRGTFLCSKACIPYLKKSENPHILMLSPPLSFAPKWFKNHVAYTIAKFGMSMCVLGMSEEFRKDGIAVNALWPKTIISTAALMAIFSDASMMEKVMKGSRKPEIVADAAHAILTTPSKELTGQFLIDEEVLKSKGIHDFSFYATDPKEALVPDYFI